MYLLKVIDGMHTTKDIVQFNDGLLRKISQTYIYGFTAHKTRTINKGFPRDCHRENIQFYTEFQNIPEECVNFH